MTSNSEDTLVVIKDGPNFRTSGAVTRDVGHRIPRPDLGPSTEDGAWASWSWNGSELTVRTCPHGSISVYYAVLPDGIAVSFSIVALLAAGADDTLDWAGLSVAIRAGCFVGERTPFRGIRVVPPDAELRWSGGAPSISPSKARDVAPPMWALTFDQAVDAYLDLMSAAVRRRRPDGPFVMPLTGGRDSRHILLELNAQGHRPDTVMTSHHYHDFAEHDVGTARTVASRLGAPHETVTIPPYSRRRQIRACAEADYCVFGHVWAFTLAERLARFETTYDGLNGGALFGRAGQRQAGNRQLARAGKWDEAAHMFLRAHEQWLDPILADGVREKLSVQVAAETVRAELDRFRSWPNPWGAFYYWNRVRRDTAYYTFKLVRNRIVHCPIDDIDMVRFALSLPADFCIDGRLQTVAVRKRFPEFADIPFVEELPRASRGWLAKRRDNVFRSRVGLSMLIALATRSSELLDIRHVASVTAKTSLLGRGRDFTTVPPLATYLLALEGVRRTRLPRMREP